MGWTCITIKTFFSWNSVICRHIKPKISQECLWVWVEDQWHRHGRMGGFGPTHFCSDPSWDSHKSVDKCFIYRGCPMHVLYIVNFYYCSPAKKNCSEPQLFLGWRRHCGGCFIRLWRCHLLSMPSGDHASGRRWDYSGLDHGVQRCFNTKWYSDVLGAQSTWDGDTGTENDSSFAGFLNLTNMPCSVLPWQAALQVILISLKSP